MENGRWKNDAGGRQTGAKTAFSGIRQLPATQGIMPPEADGGGGR
ncbi:MAG: hypothetical protein ACYS8W_06915 [Planctomycetota bacterium]